MKNRNLITAIIIAVAAVMLFVVIKGVISMAKSRKKAPSVAMKAGSEKAAVKKQIPKGKGALTVKIFNSKNAEIPMAVRIFKSAGSDSGIYAASTVGSRMQELLPGTYDIVIDTNPQKLVKGIKVNEGKETVKDLGCVTGSLLVSVVNAKKAPAYYPIRVLYGKTNEMVMAFMTNKATDIIPGVYDVEVGTYPRQYKKNIRVDAGTETIADFGCLTGMLTVKTIDEKRNDVRSNIRIMKADTNEMVTAGASNRPIELIKGKYNIEVLSNPRQTKKDVSIDTGQDSVIEFTVTASEAPKAPAPAAKQPAKAKK
jgi:hypothetical protein